MDWRFREGRDGGPSIISRVGSRDKSIRLTGADTGTGVMFSVFFPKFGIAKDGREGLEPDSDALRSTSYMYDCWVYI